MKQTIEHLYDIDFEKTIIEQEQQDIHQLEADIEHVSYNQEMTLYILFHIVLIFEVFCSVYLWEHWDFLINLSDRIAPLLLIFNMILLVFFLKAGGVLINKIWSSLPKFKKHKHRLTLEKLQKQKLLENKQQYIKEHLNADVFNSSVQEKLKEFIKFHCPDMDYPLFNQYNTFYQELATYWRIGNYQNTGKSLSFLLDDIKARTNMDFKEIDNLSQKLKKLL